jgi:hypothetical protein
MSGRGSSSPQLARDPATSESTAKPKMREGFCMGSQWVDDANFVIFAGNTGKTRGW